MEFYLARQELDQLIDVVKRFFPILAEQMKEVLREMFDHAPLTSKALYASWDKYPGQEERRLQRYERWKAHYEKVYQQDVEDGNKSGQQWALHQLAELEKRYSAPLIQSEEKPQKSKIDAVIDKMKLEEKRQTLDTLDSIIEALGGSVEDQIPDGDQIPDSVDVEVDTDVWNLDFLDEEE